MSRLEQMRQHFLQKVLCEQQHQWSAAPVLVDRSISRLSCAKSTHHIPNQLKATSPMASLKRTPSGLQSLQFGSGNVVVKTNISRVRSLNSVYLMSPNATKANSANNQHQTGVESHYQHQQQQQRRQRNATPSVNNNAVSTNNAKVNRPTRPATNGSRVLATLPPATTPTTPLRSQHISRATANNVTNELQCKHCERKFAFKERLDKHVDICAKTFHKQRPQFSSSKQRLKGHLEKIKSTGTIDSNQGRFQLNSIKNDMSIEENSFTNKTEVYHSNKSDMLTATDKSCPSWQKSRNFFLKTIKEAKRKMQQQNIKEQEESVNDEENFMCCSYCKRTFTASVIVKHEIICGKLYRKKHFNF